MYKKILQFQCKEIMWQWILPTEQLGTKPGAGGGHKRGGGGRQAAAPPPPPKGNFKKKVF